MCLTHKINNKILVLNFKIRVGSGLPIGYASVIAIRDMAAGMR